MIGWVLWKGVHSCEYAFVGQSSQTQGEKLFDELLGYAEYLKCDEFFFPRLLKNNSRYPDVNGRLRP